MFGVSMWEILVVLGLLVVLVGPDRLPGLAKTMGKALGKMRRSVDDIKQQTGLDEELDFLDEIRDVGREVSEGMGPPDQEPLIERRPPKKSRQRKGRQKVSGPRKRPQIRDKKPATGGKVHSAHSAGVSTSDTSSSRQPEGKQGD